MIQRDKVAHSYDIKQQAAVIQAVTNETERELILAECIIARIMSIDTKAITALALSYIIERELERVNDELVTDSIERELERINDELISDSIERELERINDELINDSIYDIVDVEKVTVRVETALEDFIKN